MSWVSQIFDNTKSGWNSQEVLNKDLRKILGVSNRMSGHNVSKILRDSMDELAGMGTKEADDALAGLVGRTPFISRTANASTDNLNDSFGSIDGSPSKYRFLQIAPPGSIEGGFSQRISYNSTDEPKLGFNAIMSPEVAYGQDGLTKMVFGSDTDSPLSSVYMNDEVHSADLDKMQLRYGDDFSKKFNTREELEDWLFAGRDPRHNSLSNDNYQFAQTYDEIQSPISPDDVRLLLVGNKFNDAINGDGGTIDYQTFLKRLGSDDFTDKSDGNYKVWEETQRRMYDDIKKSNQYKIKNAKTLNLPNAERYEMGTDVLNGHPANKTQLAYGILGGNNYTTDMVQALVDYIKKHGASSIVPGVAAGGTALATLLNQNNDEKTL